MPEPVLTSPRVDPTPIFEIFRGNYATELLTAAVAHFGVFGKVAEGPMTFEELKRQLGLAERPAIVLITALRAFGLLVQDLQGRLELSALAREHLTPSSGYDLSGYVSLAADSPGVLAIVERLRSNRPAGVEPGAAGAAFIYREGVASAMDREESARRLTLALSGRARSVAPVLADRVPVRDSTRLLDVGGGSGLYSMAYLLTHPHLTAIVWDRPEVLKVAREMAERFGVANRLECAAGDMFSDPVPSGADVVLLSNVLHDWDVAECRTLIARCAGALQAGGRLLIHDVFLNDELDGPLPIALYSAALFCLTEGRAYSAAEYRAWLAHAGLVPGEIVPTLAHCGVLPSVKA
jgi:ubiquinone/menaquinone biosynthesis C-methylase UbiE